MTFNFLEITIHDYEKLLETGERSDAIIYAGENEKEFRVHSAILSIRSQYFRASFSNRWAKTKDGMLILKKPNIEPNILKIILRFIYCGNIDLRTLQNSEVLKLLIAVDELNIQSLVSCIQDYLIEKQSEFLNQNSVEVLETVCQHESFTNLWEFFLERICEVPGILFSSNKFIDLKPSMMELLLKRDDLHMDEIIIWDNLLKWGFSQNPTISPDPTKWNKEEVAILDRTLHRFIPLVRFYCITSADFFYKVLPYKKLIPKQLTYEVSEFHMVQSTKIPTNALPPRQSKFINYGSTIVDSQKFALFAGWIDKRNESHYNSKNIPYQFNLLYRASRDGLSAMDFHERCDDKGATITIVKIKNSDQLIGGYNPLTWDKSDTTKPTKDSFLFTFTDTRDTHTAKISRVINENKAIHCYANHGPSFGSHYDLIYNTSHNVWFCSPYNYAPTGLIFTKRNFGVTNFDAEDYEVFQVVRLT